MLFSYNWLKDYLEYNLTSADIKYLLTSYSPLEVEAVEKIGQDYVFDIKILANRMSDCSSHFGIARELNILAFNNNFKKISYRQLPFKINTLKTSALKTSDYIDVVIKSNKDCFKYGGILLEVIKDAVTPQLIKKRLEIVGVKSINPIVDLSNYIMIDSGQPTHAFDLDKLCSSKKKKKIIIRRAKNGESISALDGKTYNLDPDILVIADEEKPIAIAGIKGGVSTAISPDTKIVFLEYAIFNPQLIYQASKKLSLTSDASLRFSHGVLDESTKRGVNLFKKLASKYNIAYPSRFEVQKGDNNSKSIKKIRVDKNYFDQRLGINLSDKKISSIIKSIGCKVKQDKQKFIITTPPFRQDLQIKEDIVEEVGRIYGFNLLPYDFLGGNISPIQDESNFLQENKIREILRFNSFDEVFTTSFLSQEQINYFNQKDQESLRVKNFLSLKYQFLRPSLLPGLLNIIAKNDDNFSTIKIFEIGKVFFPEKKSLAIASMGATKIKEVLSEFTDFYLVKKIINQIGQAFKIGDFEINQVPTSQNNSYLKAFEIKLNQKVIGLIGYINQSILSRLNIKKAVAFSEIDLDLVFKAKPQGVSFKSFTDFPKIIRDISFFAPQDLLYKDIEKTIKSVKIDFLEDFYLIDTYQAQKNGPLSLTLRFVFRHNKRTLKDEEANNQKEKIEKLLVEKFKVTIR